MIVDDGLGVAPLHLTLPSSTNNYQPSTNGTPTELGQNLHHGRVTDCDCGFSLVNPVTGKCRTCGQRVLTPLACVNAAFHAQRSSPPEPIRSASPEPARPLNLNPERATA